MDWFSMLEKFINEHASAGIQKERIIQRDEIIQHLRDEHNLLKEKNTLLNEKNEILQRELKELSIPENFIKYRGVLFSKLPDGRIDECAYCPTCKTPMYSIQEATNFECSRCRFVASFTGEELPQILRDNLK
ncbi:MAG: hypothetical protein C4518_08615 [Desulfobacteraceae bacterium]|nr:MAG: hypothetical protein C4518_08615 [Desulfobacteraceae bacterium]